MGSLYDERPFEEWTEDELRTELARLETDIRERLERAEKEPPTLGWNGACAAIYLGYRTDAINAELANRGGEKHAESMEWLVNRG